MAGPEEPPRLPIGFGPVSNGEYDPVPHSAAITEAIRRAHAMADDHARRLGMSRRQFLSTLSGAAVTLFALNACSSEQSRSGGDGEPGGTFDVSPESTIDRDAAAAELGGDEFVFDVQTHLLEFDLTQPAPGGFSIADIFPWARECGEDDPRACFTIERYMEEIFLRSDTSLVVLSAIPLPEGVNPLPVEVMEETVRIATALCRDERVLIHGQALPNSGPPEAALDDLAALRAAHDIAGWKVYTHQPTGFWLDDHDPEAPRIGTAFVERILELGPPILCVHKGLRDLGAPRYHPFASPEDIGPTAAAHPDLNLVVYHSGYETDVTEGPYDPSGPAEGVDRLLKSMDDAGIGPHENVYAELGSTWFNLMRSPTEAAHVVGKLLRRFGEDNVVWGTDSIWYGSPQDQIQAFRTFEISEELREEYGYPALTADVKRKILGLNSARLYGIEPEHVPCPFTREELEAVRVALPPDRTHGPTDRREAAARVAAQRGLA